MDGASKGCLLAIAAAVVGLLLGVLLLVSIIGETPANCGSGTAAQPTASATAANSIPGDYLQLYQAAGQRYGIPWNVLAGIGKVETDHGRSNLPGVHSGNNFAGAGGPMQFLQPTWDIYGVDGNGDGRKDRYDPADAIPGAANYLKASGAPGDLHKAILAYNHAEWYVTEVMGWAKRYAAGDFSTGANNATGACPAGMNLAPGSAFGAKVVAVALSQRGVRYQWGGGDKNGATYSCGGYGCGAGFDCSGLVRYAIYQASAGRIYLQEDAKGESHDPRGQPIASDLKVMAPGDIVGIDENRDGSWAHVVIYMGGGMVVQAPHHNDVVKVSPISDFNGMPWSVRRFG